MTIRPPKERNHTAIAARTVSGAGRDSPSRKAAPIMTSPAAHPLNTTKRTGSFPERTRLMLTSTPQKTQASSTPIAPRENPKADPGL